MLASASLTWKYSANTPSLMLANFHPPSAPPDCEECPACEAESVQSGVIAPTTIWSPGLKRLTAAPTWWTTPTASCPRVRFSRGPIAPWTVCTSEVQMRALVVLTIASVGPGTGIGLSANPTLPIPFITKARIAVDLPRTYQVRMRMRREVLDALAPMSLGHRCRRRYGSCRGIGRGVSDAVDAPGAYRWPRSRRTPGRLALAASDSSQPGAPPRIGPQPPAGATASHRLCRGSARAQWRLAVPPQRRGARRANSRTVKGDQHQRREPAGHDNRRAGVGRPVKAAQERA